MVSRDEHGWVVRLTPSNIIALAVILVSIAVAFNNKVDRDKVDKIAEEALKKVDIERVVACEARVTKIEAIEPQRLQAEKDAKDALNDLVEKIDVLISKVSRLEAMHEKASGGG
jgi:hypothetical protein